MEQFSLTGNDFIELKKLLKVLGIAETGGHAKHIVRDEVVYVNDELETRSGKKLVPGDIVKIEDLKIKITE